MSDNTYNGKEVPAFSTHEPGWVDIDLGPRNVDPKCRQAKATVIGQISRWTDFDVEAAAPSKKRLSRFGKKSMIIVGIGLIAMLLTGTIVPMVVAVRRDQGKGI